MLAHIMNAYSILSFSNSPRQTITYIDFVMSAMRISSRMLTISFCSDFCSRPVKSPL